MYSLARGPGSYLDSSDLSGLGQSFLSYTGNGMDLSQGVQLTSASLRAETGIGSPHASTLGLAGIGTTVTVHTGGITFNLLFDAASSASTAAASSFRAGLIQAASILSSAFSDQITVNISIQYSGTGGGAAAGPNYQISDSYSTLSVTLKADAGAGNTTFNNLPTSISGSTNVDVFLPQAKALGLFAANDTTSVDGTAIFSTDISANALVGVAIHEFTHAMGRVPDGNLDIFDLFRFTSVNQVLVSGAIPSPAAYFSIDGGATVLANYGLNSDPSDFLNTGVQGSADPLNEYYSPGQTSQTLSAVDIEQMVALGFHAASASSTPPTTYTVANFMTAYLANQISAPAAISDTAANISASFDQLNTASKAGKISAVTINDGAALNLSAIQVANDAKALALVAGAYELAVSDTAANISANLGTLESQISHLKFLSNTNPSTALAISSAQSVSDHQVLALLTADKLTITGTAAADTLLDTTASTSTMTGGAGADTFSIHGHANITDLGNGADILQVASGGSATATLMAAWAASAATTNLGSATINTAGFTVNLSAVASGNGFTVHNTSSHGTTLIGSSGNDMLIGGIGNDILIGGGGNDTLTGGGGNNQFVFNAKPNATTNFDTITDFNGAKDILEFSKAIFSGVAEAASSGTGHTLNSAGELLISATGTTGQNSVEHFIYNTTSGILYYDATGTGSSVAVTMLGISIHPTLTYSDIHIIA
jgi:hypothetical protein